MTAIDDMLQQPVAQAVGWALLQFVWQGALIGAADGAALPALRRSAADVRYVVATIALALMLTLPVVTAVQALRRRAAPTPARPAARRRRRCRRRRASGSASSCGRRAPRRLSAPSRRPALRTAGCDAGPVEQLAAGAGVRLARAASRCSRCGC